MKKEGEQPTIHIVGVPNHFYQRDEKTAMVISFTSGGTTLT